ncbi:hypothetical protein TRIUR3_28873 [Triticum urartu]|uniref:Uncharacterized protein n=1 Tax=Triticum urartu TaxID=4572 RepID=M7Z7C4_TRIUA|nr:hypothetical protein TRIUR3_28873 [Triticum urartu]
MARRPCFCYFVAHNRRPPAPISLLRPPLAAAAPCRSSRWNPLSSAEAPLLRPSFVPPPPADRPDPVVIHVTKPRPRPAFHCLASDLLRTGSSLNDPSPTSMFDSSPDPEVLVVPLPRCVLHRSSPTDAFVQSPRKGSDQQHKPHRATTKTCLVDQGPSQAVKTVKTDYKKLPSTSTHKCVETAPDIDKYTTSKTT